jgi:hypothetical protein
MITKAKVMRLARRPGGLQRLRILDLPEELKGHWELRNHPLGRHFKQAEINHLKSHKDMMTWEVVDTPPNTKQILDCK